MKKILVVLMIVMMLATLCACNYVPSTRFLSKAQVNAIAKNFDDPQAEMTLDYTSNGENVEVKITYNLLLTKTPLAAIRFIQLTNEGFYDDTVVDYYNSTNHYWTLGRYRYEESKIQTQGKMVYLQNPCDKTFKGEFESNGYGMPKGGYAKFRILSLAMYYEPWTETDNTFDTANGHLIMSAANESSNASTLNSANYAVFAEMDSISVSVDRLQISYVSGRIRRRFRGKQDFRIVDDHCRQDPRQDVGRLRLVQAAPRRKIIPKQIRQPRFGCLFNCNAQNQKFRQKFIGATRRA